jgi:transmembrane sensor
MNNGTSLTKEQREALPPSARAEAAAWVARLHSSDRTPALETGFRRWIEANPAHAAAFEIATDAWELGGSIPASRFPRMAHPGLAPRSFLSAQRLVIVAGLCVVAIGAGFYINRDNSVITTGVGEQRMLTLEDGSRIYLNTDTKLAVHFDKDRRLVRLVEGEAMFDVAKNPSRPFIVDAGEKQVRAVGTEFVVRRDPHELAVTLVEGTVRIADQESRDATNSSGPAGQQPKILTAGQRLTFADHKPPTLDQPQLDVVTAWRRGEVVLDKTRLEDAAEEMNRYSQVKLIVENPETSNIRVSGVFRVGDSARFAEAVAETYRLRVDHQRTQIIISGVRQ